MSKFSMEEELEKKGMFLFQTLGCSMEPLLHSRLSTVRIERITDEVRRYDAVVFVRPNGKHVLHRVVWIGKKNYYICGDNQAHLERVPKEWVIGRMTGWYPDETDRFITSEELAKSGYLKTWWLRFARRWAGQKWRRLLSFAGRRINRGKTKERQKNEECGM